MYDESIKPFLKHPPLDLLKEIREWCRSVKNEYEDTIREYKKYYEAIKTDLPENIVNMNKDYNFHDAEVLTVEVVNDYLNIKLEYGPCYSLTFVGVKLFEKPDEIIGCSWIHDEVHLSDRGKFKFCVLFHGKGF